MRIDEMPKVEVVIVPSGDFWGGVGEPTIAVAAPAVLNAIFAATGKRIRSLPLMNHDLRSRLTRSGGDRAADKGGTVFRHALAGLAVLVSLAGRRRQRPRRRRGRVPARAATRQAPRCKPRCRVLSAGPAAEIVTAMQAFRAGQRPATVMDRIAKGFSERRDRGHRGVVRRAED